MPKELKVEIQVQGAEKPLAGFDDASRMNIGQSTYNFVRQLMRDPETRALIQTRVAQSARERRTSW